METTVEHPQPNEIKGSITIVVEEKKVTTQINGLTKYECIGLLEWLKNDFLQRPD
jgi:hypothetical protein